MQLCLLLTAAVAQAGWWMREPIRWVQNNLRQVDTMLDAKRLAEQLADMRANVVLMGGIVSYYPTSVQYALIQLFLADSPTKSSGTNRGRIQDHKDFAHSGNLDIKSNSGYAEFTIPQLNDYEFVILE